MKLNTRFARLALVAAALAAAVPAAFAAQILHHVHGLAFSSDGSSLYIPSHFGLAIWRDGRWSKNPGPDHDFMGFSATRRHLYSSGHPAHGSGLVNPFGLLQSADDGKTWLKLGLEGEADFHVMAAGYDNPAVYVYNTVPNSRMQQTGIHFTLDEGMRWSRAAAQGLQGKLLALAVHPSDPKRLAAATERGLFVSKDAGGHFHRLAGGQAFGVAFDLDGRHLWWSTYSDRALLKRIELAGDKPQDVSLPRLKEDAVAYIAQNPARPSMIAVATFKRSVYLSEDGGRTWKQLADQGNAREGS